MFYTEEKLKNVLLNIKDDPARIIYTEHFLEKIECREILDEYILDKLQFTRAIGVEKLESNNRFELRFPFNGEDDLIIIVSLFPFDSIILITAFLKRRLK